jgi:hypothetical protein
VGEGSTEVGRVIDERALVLLRDDEENMEKILDFLFSSTLPDMAGSDEGARVLAEAAVPNRVLFDLDDTRVCGNYGAEF